MSNMRSSSRSMPRDTTPSSHSSSRSRRTTSSASFSPNTPASLKKRPSASSINQRKLSPNRRGEIESSKNLNTSPLTSSSHKSHSKLQSTNSSSGDGGGGGGGSSSSSSLPPSSVSVSVRLRPLFSSERENGATEVFLKESDTALIEQKPDGGLQTWQFMHKCFGPHDNTALVFESVCAPLLDQLLEGFNASFFAYGQTASGKTHTIFGHEEEQGLIANAMSHVFSSRELVNATQDRIDVKMSIIEIYNEQLSDLLAEDYEHRVHHGDHSSRDHRDSAATLTIGEDPKLGVFVRGCQIMDVDTPEEAVGLVHQAFERRSQGATDLNQASSRSHVVVRLQVEKSFGVSGSRVRTSVCNFIDLAGSERAKRTGATGTALKEASRINRSLMQLGLVITRLAEGASAHIPYRSSKLTHLLTDALGGRSLAAMVTCCSPASSDRDETLNSLKYAARAIAVKNHIVANEMSSLGLNGGGGFEVFRDELEMLKSKLAASEAAVLEKEMSLAESNENIALLTEQVELLREGISEIREEHQENQLSKQRTRSEESDLLKLKQELEEKREEIMILREEVSAKMASPEGKTMMAQGSPTSPATSYSIQQELNGTHVSPIVNDSFRLSNSGDSYREGLNNSHYHHHQSVGRSSSFDKNHPTTSPPQGNGDMYGMNFHRSPTTTHETLSQSEVMRLQSKNTELEIEVGKLRLAAAQERKKLETQLQEFIKRTEVEMSVRRSVSVGRLGERVNPLLDTNTESRSRSRSRGLRSQSRDRRTSASSPRLRSRSSSTSSRTDRLTRRPSSSYKESSKTTNKDNQPSPLKLKPRTMQVSSSASNQKRDSLISQRSNSLRRSSSARDVKSSEMKYNSASKQKRDSMITQRSNSLRRSSSAKANKNISMREVQLLPHKRSAKQGNFAPTKVVSESLILRRDPNLANNGLSSLFLSSSSGVLDMAEHRKVHAAMVGQSADKVKEDVIPKGFEFFVSTRTNILLKEIAEGKKTEELLAIPVYANEEEELKNSSVSSLSINGVSSSKPTAKQRRESFQRSNSTRSFIAKKQHPWQLFWPREDMVMPPPGQYKREPKKALSKSKPSHGSSLSKREEDDESGGKGIISSTKFKESDENSGRFLISALDITSSDVLISMIQSVIQKNESILALAEQLHESHALSPRDFWFKYFSLARSVRATVIQQARAMASSSYLSDGAAGATGIVLRSVGTALSLPHARNALPPLAFLRHAALNALHEGVDLTLIHENLDHYLDHYKQNQYDSSSRDKKIDVDDKKGTNVMRREFEFSLKQFEADNENKTIVFIPFSPSDTDIDLYNNASLKVKSSDNDNSNHVATTRNMIADVATGRQSHMSIRLWVEKGIITRKPLKGVSPSLIHEIENMGKGKEEGENEEIEATEATDPLENNVELFLVWRFYTPNILSQNIMSDKRASQFSGILPFKYIKAIRGLNPSGDRKHRKETNNIGDGGGIVHDETIQGKEEMNDDGPSRLDSVFGVFGGSSSLDKKTPLHEKEGREVDMFSSREPLRCVKFQASSIVERDALVEALTLLF